MGRLHASLLGTLLYFTPVQGVADGNAEQGSVPKRAVPEEGALPRTVGHIRLDLEKATIAHDMANYLRLDDLLLDSKKKIRRQKSYSYEDAIQTLIAINVLIQEHGFKKCTNQYLLNEGLATREFDCDLYSTAYISIGEVNGFPISGVNVPSHMFVRWRLKDGTYINWETMDWVSRDDSHYLDTMKSGKNYKGANPAFLTEENSIRELTRDELVDVFCAITSRHVPSRSVMSPDFRSDVLHSVLNRYYADQIKNSPTDSTYRRKIDLHFNFRRYALALETCDAALSYRARDGEVWTRREEILEIIAKEKTRALNEAVKEYRSSHYSARKKRN